MEMSKEKVEGTFPLVYLIRIPSFVPQKHTGNEKAEGEGRESKLFQLLLYILKILFFLLILLTKGRSLASCHAHFVFSPKTFVPTA